MEISKEKTCTISEASEELSLTVDYNKTIEQAIADGEYGWKNDSISSKSFPIPAELVGKKVEVLARLFNFNGAITYENVILEMDKVGYRPANILEFLVLGSTYPDLQRLFPIIALGSLWQYDEIDCFVPGMHVSTGKRSLYTIWVNYDWTKFYRFLGVPK